MGKHNPGIDAEKLHAIGDGHGLESPPDARDLYRGVNPSSSRVRRAGDLFPGRQEPCHKMVEGPRGAQDQTRESNKE
jgi:hypothetical protein